MIVEKLWRHSERITLRYDIHNYIVIQLLICILDYIIVTAYPNVHDCSKSSLSIIVFYVK